MSELPPEIPLPDGGHSRCWLVDPAVAGDRYRMHLTASEAVNR